MSDGNKDSIILNSLPDSYSEVKTTIKYGRDSVTLDIVLNALRSRDLELKKQKRKDAEAMFARDRNEKKNFKSNNNRTRGSH